MSPLASPCRGTPWHLRERTPDVIEAERQILRAMRDRERLFVRAGWRVRPRHDPDAR